VNKNTLLLSITVIISLALIYTLFQDDDVNLKNHQPSTHNITSNESKTVTPPSEIKYIKSSTVTDDGNEVLQNTTKKIAQKREKYLETRVFDQSKKFEIALINPNQDLSRNDGRYRNLQGKIDGQTFNLPVPLYLIEEGSGDVKLRIRNLETNERTSTTAAFIDDMTLPSMHTKLDINSQDPDNYQQINIEQLTPTRPGM